MTIPTPQILPDVREAFEAYLDGKLHDSDELPRRNLWPFSDASLIHSEIFSAGWAARGAILTPAAPVEWSVKILQDWDPRRLRLTIGIQSFDLDIHDEPAEIGRMEWYCAQLTEAMEKLTIIQQKDAP